MEYIILGMLLTQSMTIYELNKNFENGLSMIYAASYGNLQYAVKKLLAKGMITFEERVENGRNKKIYHIKEQGVQEFFRWMMDDIDPRHIETLMLAKVYFLGFVEDDGDKRLIIDKILKAGEEHVAGLSEIQSSVDSLELPPEAWKYAKYSLSTLDYAFGSYDFAISWLKKLRSEI